MFQPEKDEKVIMILHKHWFVIAAKMTVIAILLFFALAAILLIPFLVAPQFLLMSFFIVSLFILAVLLIAFVFWVDYYLDIWIITDKRIIDIQQKGLFNREISEFMLNRVQDVNVEIPNFFATIMGFGNIRVQTAGEQAIDAENIPNPSGAKNAIMEQVRKSKPL